MGWRTKADGIPLRAGREQGRGGEEELGTELYSQEFPISKVAVN